MKKNLIKVEPIVEFSGNIREIEETYNCRFVMETCINQRTDCTGNWINSPWLLFYSNAEAHPRGSKWLAFGMNGEDFVVTDGQSVANRGLAGYYNPETGESLYSLYRHDYRQDKSKTFAVDGGRDYLKVVGTPAEGFVYGTFHAFPDTDDTTKDAGLYFKVANK